MSATCDAALAWRHRKCGDAGTGMLLAETFVQQFPEAPR